MAAITQAVCDGVEVGEEFARIGVAAVVVGVVDSAVGLVLGGGGEPGLDDAQRLAVAFARVGLSQGLGGLGPVFCVVDQLQKRIAHGVVLVGNAQRAFEGEALGEVFVDDRLSEFDECLARHIRCDKWVAIPVAADPCAKADDALECGCLLWERMGQRAARPPHQPRHDTPKRINNKERTIHFIQHGRSRGAQRLGFPKAIEVRLDPAKRVLTLTRQVRLAVEVNQILAQPAQRVADSAALGLGRVRCKNEVDIELAEHRLHLIGAVPIIRKLLNRSAERLAPRLGRKLTFALAQNTNTVSVFREIGQVKETRQRPHEFAQLVILKRSDAIGQRSIRIAIAFAPILRERSDLFHQVIEPCAGVAFEDFTQLEAEHAHIAPQRKIIRLLGPCQRRGLVCRSIHVSFVWIFVTAKMPRARRKAGEF